ncbi:SGNH/GDSL hydrolase family protein [Streptomyces sp. ISL-96]|uniref:SGNH/GDSL hydrolase family protein n=1 Tax=Streptomyces sp. ISL-96 TaxID=2819191 RepID=UPI001BE80E8F|nr:SGNH/GDSL hydrolase family protein [Streptomyces sp. ISL-96]MBT2492566.1 SGNH/GDSL hydrolase family protein [Streptomyces sp. ISL-96]
MSSDEQPEPSGTSVPYARYVALGDSQTEGLGDGGDVTGLRGWADRLAEHLVAANPRLEYANLAVRGRLAGQVRAEQLAPALAMRPDLVTVVAGVNDLMRPKFDVVEVVGHLEAMFAAFAATGARVVTVTFPDMGQVVPLARPLRPRVYALNAGIRAAAARHGVAVVETADHAFAVDPRVWTTDRLHLSPLGHERFAAAAHAALRPGADDAWTHALPPQPALAGWRAANAELRWATAHLGPWLGRRLRGRSSGDGRTAKRPQLVAVGAVGLPVRPPVRPPESPAVRPGPPAGEAT